MQLYTGNNSQIVTHYYQWGQRKWSGCGKELNPNLYKTKVPNGWLKELNPNLYKTKVPNGWFLVLNNNENVAGCFCTECIQKLTPRQTQKKKQKKYPQKIHLWAVDIHLV